jgi:hypothetical protein
LKNLIGYHEHGTVDEANRAATNQVLSLQPRESSANNVRRLGEIAGVVYSLKTTIWEVLNSFLLWFLKYTRRIVDLTPSTRGLKRKAGPENGGGGPQ